MRVAVVDEVPAYRRGLVSLLAQNGIAADEPQDPVRWAREAPHGASTTQRKPPVLLLALRREEHYRVLRDVGGPDPLVLTVALLMEDSAPDYVRALRAGARCAVPYTAAVERIYATLMAAVDGDLLVPFAALQGLLAECCPRTVNGEHIKNDRSGGFSGQELVWLRSLGRGVHVSELAQTAHLSQRSMFRQLNSIYHRLGATNRQEAILRAQSLGILDA